MKHSWGRFTARGSQKVEDQIANLVENVAAAFRENLRPDEYRALVLIGGYGRGEGGVELTSRGEVPHNNLDFLLITPGRTPPASLKERLDTLIEPISRAAGVHMDLSITNASKLRRSPPLVIWCDMRFGHKTILGDAEFVPALTHLEPDLILPGDVRNLLVNRGTLLVINELLLARMGLSAEDRRTVVRHAIKAIIGYGDALLFFLGDYHWSYQEKQRRMSLRQDVSAQFRKLYDDAMEFRFQPRYEPFLERDLSAWMAELRKQFSPLHLRCESLRLKESIHDWRNYLEPAFRHSLFEGLGSGRALLRKGSYLVRGPAMPKMGSLGMRLGLRCGGHSSALSILFPVVAYDVSDSRARELAKEVLGADTTGSADLRDAYLYKWGLYGDTNFPRMLKKLGIIPRTQSEPSSL